MRRPLSALALALLLTISGCSALGIGNTGPSDTPRSVDVPGVEDGQLSNETALLEAHRTALLETGFVTDIRVNATTSRRTESGTEVVPVVRRQETRVRSDAAGYRFELENRGTGATFDEWANRSVRTTRLRVGEQTRYQVGQPRPARQLTGAAVLSSYLSGAFTVESANETDGLVTLTSTTPPDGSTLPPNATDVRNYEARLVVDGEGRVHSLAVTADYTLEGESSSLSVEYGLTRTGVDTVDRPSWVGEALAS